MLLQKSIGDIKGARRAQGRAEGHQGGQEGRQGGQEGRQGGQEGRSALLFWPSWNTESSVNTENYLCRCLGRFLGNPDNLYNLSMGNNVDINKLLYHFA